MPADPTPPEWTRASKFANTAQRNRAVNQELDQLFSARQIASLLTAASLNDGMQSILDGLIRRLINEPPDASQTAEAALTLAAFSIAEGRALNVVDPKGGDLAERMRLAGDRTVSDRLCAELLRRNIPATRGPLQSSTFRSGYVSPQAQDQSLSRFALWQSEPGRTVNEVRSMAEALVDTFLSRASSMPPLPTLVASRFTFTAYRQAREQLLATGSHGALEQYLLAGLLNEELPASHAGLRVTTKNVGANDRASGTAGDIEIRRGHTLEGAIEVTAASWEDKLDQLQGVADARLSEAIIVAPDVTNTLSGKNLAAKVDPIATRLGLDVSVLDLHAMMDIAASRITKAARAEAFRFIYRCLVQYHRRQPELAERLVGILVDLGLASNDRDTHSAEPPGADPDIVFRKVRDFLTAEDIANEPDTPSALRNLASWIENGATTGDPD